MFRVLVRNILQGKALGVEDLADVLTLKDNASEADLENFIVALQLLGHAEVGRSRPSFGAETELRKGIPDARLLVSTQSVWRRMYMHDE
jgi:nuclear pore complex protein Nup133